jgi:hypothetical protein
MNIEGPYLGQLDASSSTRQDHLGGTPKESATRCSTGRAQLARFCRDSVLRPTSEVGDWASLAPRRLVAEWTARL